MKVRFDGSKLHELVSMILKLLSCGRSYFSVFGGQKCENDLIDGCSDTLCSDESMCKNTADVLNGYECLCPTDGGYQGE